MMAKYVNICEWKFSNDNRRVFLKGCRACKRRGKNVRQCEGFAKHVDYLLGGV